MGTNQPSSRQFVQDGTALHKAYAHTNNKARALTPTQEIINCCRVLLSKTLRHRKRFHNIIFVGKHGNARQGLLLSKRREHHQQKTQKYIVYLLYLRPHSCPPVPMMLGERPRQRTLRVSSCSEKERSKAASRLASYLHTLPAERQGPVCPQGLYVA